MAVNTNINITDIIIKRRREIISYQKFCEENFIQSHEDKAACAQHFTNMGLDLESQYPRYTWFVLALADPTTLW